MNRHVATCRRSQLLNIAEVIRLTGMREHQINRAVVVSGFPLPVSLEGLAHWHQSEIEAWRLALPRSSRTKFMG